MQVEVNGEARTVGAATLDAALGELGFEGPAMATAVNGEFVPKAARGGCRLSEGDRIEVLSPMQGG